MGHSVYLELLGKCCIRIRSVIHIMNTNPEPRFRNTALNWSILLVVPLVTYKFPQKSSVNAKKVFLQSYYLD
jgi:hypothetical protein